jgi:hypothetical protein
VEPWRFRQLSVFLSLLEPNALGPGEIQAAFDEQGEPAE